MSESQGERLAALAPKIMGAFHDLGQQHPKGEKVSMRQYQALIVLHTNQSLTLSQFCEKLALAPSTGTELANRLIDFFNTPGRYSAFLVGGGDWSWRYNPDPTWQKFYRRFGAYCPWNVGNYVPDPAGEKHAATYYWAEDKRECERQEMLWIPVVYPGFSWDNLKRLKPGTSLIPRRGGKFLWEQFHALSELGVDTVYVAMFDEVDEGTAIFKVTSSPPTQGCFVGYDGRPSDWYLRLVGEAARRLREKQPIPAEIPKL
jgi:hypothetical protein